MTDLPYYFNGSTRRRHNQNTEKSDENLNFSSRENISPIPPIVGSEYDIQKFTKSSVSKSPSGINLAQGFSNYFSTATQIWNDAQNSIQTFAEQYISSEFKDGDHIIDPSRDLTREICNSNPEMPFRDRTAEFRTIAKSSQMRYEGTTKNLTGKEKMIKSSIHFNQLARRIGRDLSVTCAKMEKLAELARRKSLFDDRASEIEELCQMIKHDITGLNKQISNLQQVGQEKANQSVSNEKQGQDHSKLVVVGLQSKLATVSKAFQSALELRTENLKLKRNRREKFSKSVAFPPSLPETSSASLLLQDDIQANGSVSVNMDHLEQHRIQEQALLVEEDEYHQSRYNAMENIESSISELGVIFRQLATLVSEQGEMITRIDSNVESTSINIETAHHELLKYFNNISKNRWLIIKVFGVLMAFFVFFVIFMA